MGLKSIEIFVNSYPLIHELKGKNLPWFYTNKKKTKNKTKKLQRLFKTIQTIIFLCV